MASVEPGARSPSGITPAVITPSVITPAVASVTYDFNRGWRFGRRIRGRIAIAGLRRRFLGAGDPSPHGHAALLGRLESGCVGEGVGLPEALLRSQADRRPRVRRFRRSDDQRDRYLNGIEVSRASRRVPAVVGRADGHARAGGQRAGPSSSTAAESNVPPQVSLAARATSITSMPARHLPRRDAETRSGRSSPTSLSGRPMC